MVLNFFNLNLDIIVPLLNGVNRWNLFYGSQYEIHKIEPDLFEEH